MKNIIAYFQRLLGTLEAIARDTRELRKALREDRNGRIYIAISQFDNNGGRM